MNATKKLSAAGLKNIVIKTLKENKAIDVLAINIKKLTDIADYMIICTANSTTHVKSLIEKLRAQLALEHIKPIGIEGENTREWMLADFGHVIVHVMLKTTREFYSLEKLWGLNEVKKSRPHSKKE
ncbi:Ribosomal silencing factor RsfS [Gammaproteobacteria bacterium]